MGKDVIVACDFSSAEATFAFLDTIADLFGIRLFFTSPLCSLPHNTYFSVLMTYLIKGISYIFGLAVTFLTLTTRVTNHISDVK